MDYLSMSDIEMLPKDIKHPMFEQRESGRTHSPYETEMRFYMSIRQGDVIKVRRAMDDFLASGIVAGRLSNDSLRQMQYLAVSSVTLATRFAIQGGLDQMEAYNLSDNYIRQIDSFCSPDEILQFLKVKALELTALVAKEKEKKSYPASVKLCMHYINKNLHGKITLSNLSDECGLSADYLSALFKKTVGENVSRYILNKKLEAAKELLDAKYNYGALGYYFSFCSETYFISCFKRRYGMTPREYSNSLNY